MTNRHYTKFTVALFVLGVLMAAAVAFDLMYRGMHQFPIDPQWPLGEGDPRQGGELIAAYGCGACHVIPGIHQANGRVGPKLEEFAHQMYIAGVLPNTPQDLAQWLQRPQEINPLTAMPNLNVTAEEARHMVAYLYTAR